MAQRGGFTPLPPLFLFNQNGSKSKDKVALYSTTVAISKEVMHLIDAGKLIELFIYALENLWGYIYGTWGQKVWTQTLQNQKVNYMVTNYGEDWKNSDAAKADKYYYSAKDGKKWIGHYVADCSGLFRWAYDKLGQKIAHNSNTIWASYCSKKGDLKNGKRTDGMELRPGTAVFVKKKTSSGSYNRSHIGLYIGNGEVIEASGTNAGVVKSSITNKKWVEWGELKAVNYDNTEIPAEPVTPEPIPEVPVEEPTKKINMKKGDKGEEVKYVQILLIGMGYDLGKWGADGDFGAKTEAAVKQFQKSKGLKVDGIVGPKTWAALTAPQDKTVTVIIPGLTEQEAGELLAKYPGSYITD